MNNLNNNDNNLNSQVLGNVEKVSENSKLENVNISKTGVVINEVLIEAKNNELKSVFVSEEFIKYRKKLVKNVLILSLIISVFLNIIAVCDLFHITLKELLELDILNISFCFFLTFAVSLIKLCDSLSFFTLLNVILFVTTLVLCTTKNIFVIKKISKIIIGTSIFKFFFILYYYYFHDFFNSVYFMFSNDIYIDLIDYQEILIIFIGVVLSITLSNKIDK